MAIIAHIILPGVTAEQYDAVRAEVGWLDQAPDGGLAHLTWWDGNDCHSTDAWEGEDALNTFAAQRLGPALAKLGVNAEPKMTLYPAHEVFLPSARTITV